MKLIEIIRNLRSLISDTSDDRKFSDRQLAFIVKYVRAELIRQDRNKGRSFSNNVIQRISCLPIEQIDASECPRDCSGKFVYRTVSTIPAPLELYDTDALVYIGSTTMDNGFQISSKAQARWAKYNRYTAGGLRAYYRAGRIYISGDVPYAMENIAIEGVFADPEQLATLNTCNGTSCFNPNTDDFPMSLQMVNTLNKMIISTEFNIKTVLEEDKLNDSQISAPNKQ